MHRCAVAAARICSGVLVATLMVSLAHAAPKGGAGGGLLPGSTSHEPVSVDAAKLDYFDKEQRLVYSGDVVARQGASTLKGSELTIFLSRGVAKADQASGGEPAAPAANSSIDRMLIKGPVTILSQDEVGTGDNGSYDKAANRITLSGNVTLTQGPNIIKGDKLVYDMTSGQAQVMSGQTQGRVTSVFTPGSSGPPGVNKPKATAKKGPKAP